MPLIRIFAGLSKLQHRFLQNVKISARLAQHPPQVARQQVLSADQPTGYIAIVRWPSPDGCQRAWRARERQRESVQLGVSRSDVFDSRSQCLESGFFTNLG